MQVWVISQTPSLSYLGTPQKLLHTGKCSYFIFHVTAQRPHMPMVKLHKCFCLSLHCSSASVCHPLTSQGAPWTRHSCLHLSQAARSSTSSQSTGQKQTGCNQVRNLGLIHLTGHDFHLSTLNNCPSRTLVLPSVEASAFSRILLRTPGARGKRYKAGCAMVNSSPTREHTCPVCSATSCVVRDKTCSLTQHPRSVHLPLWTHH